MSEKAQAARELMEKVGVGALATQSLRRAGWPFVSMVPYALDAQGRPVFVMSSLAVHSKNAKEDARVSLLVNEPAEEGVSPLEIARVTLMGEVREVPEEEQDEVREMYCERHPATREWMAFGDFRAFRMEVVDVYFIGGFGAMGWVMVGDYAAAQGGA